MHAETTSTPSPARGITLTVLYDNSPGIAGLRTDWGFACLVEGLPETLLFDTGADGALLLRNMQALGLSPDSVDVVVLSHAHPDHTGGLATFLAEAHGVRVYLLSTFPTEVKQLVRDAGADLVEVRDATGICSGAWVTGVVTPSSQGGAIPEQALVLETTDGRVVVTGCAHPGVVEMVRAAQTMSPVDADRGAGQGGGSDVDLVLGGFHLRETHPVEMEGIATALQDLGVRRVAPCHCSGDAARRLFADKYGDGYIDVGVGTRLALETLSP